MIDKPLPVVVSAAIQISGIIASLPKPARHGDIINLIWKRLQFMPIEEGFLTNEGEFLTRTEAFDLIKRNGQPVVKSSLWFNDTRELYSENLW